MERKVHHHAESPESAQAEHETHSRRHGFWEENKLPLSILVGSLLISASILWSNGVLDGLSLKGLADRSGDSGAPQAKIPQVPETGLSVPAILSYAKSLKLNTNEFEACLNNGEAAAAVSGDLADGQAAGVSGTPTFVINGVKVVGALPYAQFEAAIEAALKGQAPAGEKADVKVRGDAPSVGKKDAPVTIVEFSDFECPFCARFFAESYPQIKEKYIDTGKVRLVFRHFPLPFHANAQKAAEAAECASRQGKFSQMHDMLFAKSQ